ncbi:translation initiation factor eIF-2B subunit alpha, putative [Pediculus humanus corporis]|uniref:Translation initiation factor eIF2B subunit alpha n=1 Tax=Pediculus humanus subsp. corporis TaxID=121224 RepID=E0VKA1_PEDHC|nr:translation initiation factor eIF-2B subunit alpha, putative [Pediculus humanus corporis]EEB13807.1 translation initiation factor eIF-2B subunit alpha, putative [Pediculus humanus corporis]
MKPKEIEHIFNNYMESFPNVSAGRAAIKTLLTVLEHDKSATIQELHSTFRNAIEVMKKSKFSVTAVASGCELFMRFITLAALDHKNFQECKQVMLNRGNLFLEELKFARSKIAKLASGFITDGSKILTHSKSRVVLLAMKEAANLNKRFEVFVTTSAPDNSGRDMCKELENLNIPCTLILDSAVGYIMESIDMVMMGAEGVVESGGIINKIGSYTMALCAREASKPLYVLTESFKFVRLYPLNQRDLPAEFKFTYSYAEKDLKKADPLVDYTPPIYITLLFTDLGILTPSAVSDELIKLYL